MSNGMRPGTALALSLIAMLLVLAGWHRAAAAPRAEIRALTLAPDVARVRAVYTEEILAVLDNKITDAASRARAAEKLATLTDRQLRLMAALSDRVAFAGEGPADGIALFLLTALLILS